MKDNLQPLLCHVVTDQPETKKVATNDGKSSDYMVAVDGTITK